MRRHVRDRFLHATVSVLCICALSFALLASGDQTWINALWSLSLAMLQVGVLIAWAQRRAFRWLSDVAYELEFKLNKAGHFEGVRGDIRFVLTFASTSESWLVTFPEVNGPPFLLMAETPLNSETGAPSDLLMSPAFSAIWDADSVDKERGTISWIESGSPLTALIGTVRKIESAARFDDLLVRVCEVARAINAASPSPASQTKR